MFLKRDFSFLKKKNEQPKIQTKFECLIFRNVAQNDQEIIDQIRIILRAYP